MSRPIPFLEHGALVHGRAAVGVAWLLTRAVNGRALEGLPEGVYEETVAAIQAVDLAARAWTRRTAAVRGRTATPSPGDVAPSPHGITVEEAARVLRISPRRARDLAAAGLGRRIGGRWLLDAEAVRAEAERRGVA